MSDVTKSIGGYHFLLRRLHSLTGIVPVGVFVIFHLFTNFQLVRGGGEFQHEVDFIHSLPGLLFVEIALWLSIGFHAALGVWYTCGGQVNVTDYPYAGNRRYVLQRVTGAVALVFIFLHIATLRWRWDIFGWYTPFYAHGANGEPLVAATTAKALQSHWLVVVLYAVGALSVVYHWANGLWTAAISWGLTISVKAQRRWGQLCIALGIVLAVFTIGAIVGALTYDVNASEKKAIELRSGGQDAGAAIPRDYPLKGQGAEKAGVRGPRSAVGFAVSTDAGRHIRSSGLRTLDSGLRTLDSGLLGPGAPF